MTRHTVTSCAIALVILAACDGEERPPPPPVPICGNGVLEFGEECDDGNMVDGDGCSAGCALEAIPPPPPPPPGGADPADYLTTQRATDILEYRNSQWEGFEFELRANHFAGYVDPAYVAQHCSWATQQFFGVTEHEMAALSMLGLQLEEEALLGPPKGNDLLDKLGTVNRRCDRSHPEHDPAFCGRVEVRRDVWTGYEAIFLDHKVTWSTWRETVQPSNCPRLANQLNQAGTPERWDTIQSWCRKMNLHELRGCR